MIAEFSLAINDLMDSVAALSGFTVIDQRNDPSIDIELIGAQSVAANATLYLMDGILEFDDSESGDSYPQVFGKDYFFICVFNKNHSGNALMNVINGLLSTIHDSDKDNHHAIVIKRLVPYRNKDNVAKHSIRLLYFNVIS